MVVRCSKYKALTSLNNNIYLVNLLAVDLYIKIKAKCLVKAIPLQAWTGPEGSRRLRFPDFKAIST